MSDEHVEVDDEAFETLKDYGTVWRRNEYDAVAIETVRGKTLSFRRYKD